MSAQDFENALTTPDNDASRKLLAELACRTVSTFIAIPPRTALEYLRAFCDNRLLHLRRRWLGLALVKMVAKSPLIMDHLATYTGELAELGHVVLGDREMEETRIIAGVLIRLALLRKVRFSNLWPAGKAPVTDPFPVAGGLEWMEKFQDYIDAVIDLELLPLPGEDDYDIWYTAAISTSDDFRLFRSSHMVAINQAKVLTVMAADVGVQEITFVDIPLQHIQDLKIQQAVLHDSQATDLKHDAWDVILNLRGGHFTYLVNSSEHNGHTVTLTFPSSTTAEQCREAIDKCTSSPRKVSTSQEILTLGSSDESGDHGAAEHEETGPRNDYVPRLADNAPKGSKIPNSQVVSSNAQSRISSVIRKTSWSQVTMGLGSDPVEGIVEDFINREDVEDPLRHFTTVFPTGKDEPSSNLNGSQQGQTENRSSSVQEDTAGINHTSASAIPPFAAAADQTFFEEPERPNDTERGRTDQGKSRGHVDDHSFRSDSWRMARPSGTTKKRISYGKPRIGTGVPRSAHHQQTDIKQLLIVSEKRPNVNGRATNVVKQHTTTGGQNARSKPGAMKRSASNRSDDEGELEPENGGTTDEEQPSGNKFSSSQRVGTGPSTRPTTLKLPKRNELSQKPRSSQMASSAEVDIYAIPIEKAQVADSRTRKRRKVATPVTYNEESADEDEISESDYVESKPKRTRASTKQILPQNKRADKGRRKPQASMRTTEAKSKLSIAVVGDMGLALPKKHETASINNAKHAKHTSQTVPAAYSNPVSLKAPAPQPQELSSSQPAISKSGDRSKKASSKPQSRKETVAIDTDVIETTGAISEDDTLTDGFPQPSPTLPPPEATLRFEANLLSQLNDEDMQQKQFQALKTVAGARTPGASSQIKTPAASCTPEPIIPTPQQQEVHSTPPSTPEVKHKKTAGAAVLTTIAPSRIVEDPISPSTETKRARRLVTKPSTYKLGIRERSTAVQTNKTPKVGSEKQLDYTCTPLHQLGRRTPGSTEGEVLSSNSKPIPASPHAESTAISGHAERGRMEMEKDIGDQETAKADPFTQPQSQASKRSTDFTRRLTDESLWADVANTPSKAHYEPSVVVVVVKEPTSQASSERRGSNRSVHVIPSQRKARRARSPSPTEADRPIKRQRKSDPLQIAQSEIPQTQAEASIVDPPAQPVDDTQPLDALAHEGGSMGMDGDDTLVAEEESELPIAKTAPEHFPSSPPQAPSSHSSTSAHPSSESEQEPSSAIDQGEEQSWEASLQPHHLTIKEQLFRVSNHVLRNVVSSEAAVEDIVDEYSRDGAILLNNLVDRHSGKFESVLTRVRHNKRILKDELEKLAADLAQEQQRYE
ncbi:hypothetical protein P154DRAFT_565023 [Amniculicola lignicola CBS 123094]|uniref:Uncharacterized protein n=1 Tax=Amniculicola lignicola CBS 123094 TaxID=1392246 RepID=A0A6A5W812_9PLEO|nr:hypothetical protein P154DRAFT_565023 [Amniculicola lignicola CBS 123094]